MVLNVVETGGSAVLPGSAQKKSPYCLSGGWYIGSVILFQALVWNLGTCRLDAKGAIQVGITHKNLSTDAGHRGGSTRSSAEAFVMEVERRG